MTFWEEILRIQSLLIFACGLIAAGIGVFFRAKLAEAIKGKAEAADLRVVAERLNGVETRVGTMESALQHMPSSADMKRLELAMVEQGGEVKVILTKLDAMHETMKGDIRRMDIVDEYLRDREKAG